MSFSLPTGWRRPVTLIVAGGALTALALGTAGIALAGPAKPAPTALYLVQTQGAPIATYTGGTAGILGTKPAPGQKVNRRSWNYNSYRQYLRDQHTKVQAAAGVNGKAVAEYSTVFNGFAAALTQAEVAKLKTTPGVVNVYKNRIHTVNTVTTPTFLGLDGPGGVWQKQFGDVSHAGEGVIIGVIDTGIWPENPAFAALPEPRPDQAIIDQKWAGTCVTGDDHPIACNNKLIGARWYNKTGNKNPAEFHSPRDFDGHGSHTTSTAAGDNGVPASVSGVEIGKISGMAPAARIATYKVLWHKEDGSGASGGTVDIVDAIDDAVDDGVDVINYSIGDENDEIGPEDQAYLNAAAAGVFISASAGNSGDRGRGTVDNAAPWLTTVAASTHDRVFNKTATLGNGKTYAGAGIGPAALPATPLVDAVAAAAPGKPVTDAELCAPGTLDPAKVTGKAVLCKRGVVDRTAKSQAVKDAGGVGMVLYNATPNTLNADVHAVPSIHVGPTEGAAVKAYIAGTANPTVAISASTIGKGPAPAMADFSSIGPSKSSGGDLLKPDITAPGSDVLAAVAPPGNADQNFGFYSGTSMAAPHIAGIAALIKQKNPTWSPMAIKSAIMTTAGQLDNTGKPIQRAGANASPLDFGAGHVTPAPAFDPGLVYDSEPTDWLRYSCGIGVHLKVGPAPGEDVCPIVGTIDPSDLNYASISVGDLPGEQTVTRTVTNVGGRNSTYVAKVQAPAGITVSVNPSTLTVGAGKTASFKVTIKRTTAAFGEWAFGSLSWLDLRGHGVRSPIAVRPTALSQPLTLTKTGTSGSTEISMRTGFNGTLASKAYGLTAANVVTKDLVGTAPTFNPDAPAEGPAVAKVPLTVPAGSALARVGTYNADYGSGTDLDVYVYDKTGGLVGQSAGGSAQETVDLPAGDYEVYVVQFALPGGTDKQTMKLNTFVVPQSSAGNLTVTPASQPATIGKQVTVTAAWKGLTAGKHYLGQLVYGDGTFTATTTFAVDA